MAFAQTITLTAGAEQEITGGGIHVSVENIGTGTIYMGKNSGVVAGANTVVRILAGQRKLLTDCGGRAYLISADGSTAEATFTDFASANFSAGDERQVINEIQSEISDIEGYIGYTASDIYGVEADFENSIFTRLAGAVGKSGGADFDGVPMYGGRRRCNLADDGTVNAYYGDENYVEDGTNGQVMVEQPKFYYKVVPLKIEPNNANEIDTLTVSSGATTAGDVTITLNGVDTAITVAADDTIAAVVDKIAAGTFAGWTAAANTAKTAVVFTKTAVGAVSAPTFSAGSTGAAGTFARTQCGYIGKGYKSRKMRYYVSATPKDGFSVHPAFIKNGVELEKIYLSAYECCAYDVSASAYITDDAQTVDFTATTGDILSSIAAVKPISGTTQQLTRGNARIIAANRGTGWSQPYPATVAATQLLFIVEYGTFNSQTAIGRGVVGKDRNDGPENTGTTSALGNASGMADGTDGLVSVSYRGEENLWGNINTFVDGTTVKRDIDNSIHDIYITDNGFVDNKTTSPYANADITMASCNWYISAMAYNDDTDWIFIPVESNGNSIAPVGDSFVQKASTNGYGIYAVSGQCNGGLYAGLYYGVTTLSSGSTGDTYGCRLTYAPTA